MSIFWYQSVFTAGWVLHPQRNCENIGISVCSANQKKRMIYVTLFLSVFAISANLIGTAFKLFDIRGISSSLFIPDPSKNHIPQRLLFTVRPWS